MGSLLDAGGAIAADAGARVHDAAAALDGGGDPSDRDAEADACIPVGCEEQGFECGRADDGCGGELDCDPSVGTACEGFEYCGGDPSLGPNRCGCKPRTCAELGATCGSDVPDGCGGRLEACGTCEAGELCSSAYQCICAPAADPCGSAGRVCGSVWNGCETVSCGVCAEGTGVCSADQKRCACTTSQAVACQGRVSGTVTVDNCTFDCTAVCGEQHRLKACRDAQCGQAVNDCGDIVQCGSCGAGKKCALRRFIQDGSAPESAGYCLDESVANLLGKYAVRIHSFRQAGASGIDILTRAEAVELVTMTYNRARNRVTLSDQGCVGTATGTAIFLGAVTTPARVRVPYYHAVPPVVVELEPMVGQQWERRPVPNHVFAGGGEPTGFSPAIPSDCVGRSGQIIQRALPASGWQGAASGNSPFAPVGAQTGTYQCKCPVAAATMPEHNRATSGIIDCRVEDPDQDGLPGFTVQTTTAIGNATTLVYNASVAETVWKGTVRADRHHAAVGQDPPSTKSAILGCSRFDGPCKAPEVDCACDYKWNHVQFVPLPDTDPMTCARFFTNGNAATLNQNEIDRVFGAGFGSCTATSQCPAGTLCHSNKCKPITTPGVCSGTGQSTCPFGASCRSGSCWPTDAECDAQGASLGGMCR